MPEEISTTEATPEVETTSAPVETEAPAEVTPSEPKSEPKLNPFDDPEVKARFAELNKQISTMEKKTKSAKDLQSKLDEAQAKLKQFELAQLTEAEKKEKEFADALADVEKYKSEKAAAELENVKLRCFVGSGLKPEFLRFISGSSEDEIKESITDLQALIKASIPEPAPAPVPPAPETKATAPVKNPQAPAKRTFTTAEIANMSPAEYAKNRDAILEAAARHEIN